MTACRVTDSCVFDLQDRLRDVQTRLFLASSTSALTRLADEQQAMTALRSPCPWSYDGPAGVNGSRSELVVGGPCSYNLSLVSISDR